MKRDIDLIKEILIKVEESEEADVNGFFDVEGFTKEQVEYHIELMLESELIKAEMHYDRSWSVRLTNEGHDFVYSAKNETVWNKFKKSLAEEAKGIPMALAIPLLKEGLKRHFEVG